MWFVGCGIKNVNSLLRRMNRYRYFYSQLWTVGGEYELKILKRIVPKGCLAIDVGANSGVYSFHLSRFASKVIAFEPGSHYHAKLANLGRKIELRTEALSDETGEGKLSIPISVSIFPSVAVRS